MIGSGRFDANEAPRKLLEERQNVTTLQLTADNHLASEIRGFQQAN